MLIWPNIIEGREVLHEISEKYSNALWVVSPSVANKLPATHIAPFQVKNANVDVLLELMKYRDEQNPQALVAVGGGKTIDLAKLASRLSYMDPEIDINQKTIGSECINKESKLPLIAVPSTIGSGSESSEIAVITVNGRKVPIHSPYFLPDEVYLSTQLVQNVPQRVLWNGLWDTLSHALESALSPLANAYTLMHSLDAFKSTKLIMEQVASANVLSEMQASIAQWNSLRAGKAQSKASVGLIHALAHQCEHEEQWHGEACGRLLAIVLRKNREKAFEKIQDFAVTTNFANVETLIDWVENMAAHTIGPFRPISKTEKSFDDTLQALVKDPCFRTNPAFWTRAELAAWLREWFYVE